MSSTILKSFDVQADKDGYWEYGTSGSAFNSGNYRIQTEDESGKTQEKSVMIFRESAAASSTNSATGGIAFFSKSSAVSNTIYIVLLLVIIALLGFNLYFLVKKSAKQRAGQKTNGAKNRFSKKPIRQRNRKIKWVILAAVALLVIIIGLILIFSHTNKSKAPVVINVSGSVVNPLDNTGFSGVDLTVNNTSIKTGKSGAYNFNEIKSDEGIKITYPALLRSILKVAEEDGKLDIYFNPDMYNTLIRVIDFESRGQIEKVYQYLYPAAKNKITPDEFVKNYESIFASEDVNNQEIKIGETKIIGKLNNRKYDLYISQVVTINVINRDKNETFYLVFEGGQWWLIK